MAAACHDEASRYGDRVTYGVSRRPGHHLSRCCAQRTALLSRTTQPTPEGTRPVPGLSIGRTVPFRVHRSTGTYPDPGYTARLHWRTARSHHPVHVPTAVAPLHLTTLPRSCHSVPC